MVAESNEAKRAGKQTRPNNLRNATHKHTNVYTHKHTHGPQQRAVAVVCHVDIVSIMELMLPLAM